MDWEKVEMGLGDGAVTVGRTAVVEVEWEVSGDLGNHMQTCLPVFHVDAEVTRQ